MVEQEEIEENSITPLKVSKAREARKLQETKTNVYYGIRFLQIMFIGVAVFGALWEGTEQFKLTTPQFMMLYGAIGAGVSEVMARLFKKKMLK